MGVVGRGWRRPRSQTKTVDMEDMGEKSNKILKGEWRAVITSSNVGQHLNVSMSGVMTQSKMGGNIFFLLMMIAHAWKIALKWVVMDLTLEVLPSLTTSFSCSNLVGKHGLKP